MIFSRLERKRDEEKKKKKRGRKGRKKEKKTENQRLQNSQSHLADEPEVRAVLRGLEREVLEEVGRACLFVVCLFVFLRKTERKKRLREMR